MRLLEDVFVLQTLHIFTLVSNISVLLLGVKISLTIFFQAEKFFNQFDKDKVAKKGKFNQILVMFSAK